MCFLKVYTRFVDRDMMMRYLGNGVGHFQDNQRAEVEGDDEAATDPEHSEESEVVDQVDKGEVEEAHGNSSSEAEDEEVESEEDDEVEEDDEEDEDTEDDEKDSEGEDDVDPVQFNY